MGGLVTQHRSRLLILGGRVGNDNWYWVGGLVTQHRSRLQVLGGRVGNTTCVKNGGRIGNEIATQ